MRAAGDESSTLQGSRFSNDSLDTTATKTPKTSGARRMEMHREEDDSSDMSDDSDDDQGSETWVPLLLLPRPRWR